MQGGNLPEAAMFGGSGRSSPCRDEKSVRSTGYSTHRSDNPVTIQHEPPCRQEIITGRNQFARKPCALTLAQLDHFRMI